MHVPGPGGKFVTVDFDNPTGQPLSPGLASSQRDNLWNLQNKHAVNRLFGQAGDIRSDEELLAEQKQEEEHKQQMMKAAMMAQMRAVQGA